MAAGATASTTRAPATSTTTITPRPRLPRAVLPAHRPRLVDGRRGVPRPALWRRLHGDEPVRRRPGVRLQLHLPLHPCRWRAVLQPGQWQRLPRLAVRADGHRATASAGLAWARRPTASVVAGTLTTMAPTLAAGYTERCCPQTDRGSSTVGEECHDLPFGATCKEANQCADQLVCGHNRTCHRPSDRASRAATRTATTATTTCVVLGAPATALAGSARASPTAATASAARGTTATPPTWARSSPSAAACRPTWCRVGGQRVPRHPRADHLRRRHGHPDQPGAPRAGRVVGHQLEQVRHGQAPGPPAAATGIVTQAGGCKQLDQCADGLVCDLRGNGPRDSPFQTDHQCIPVMDAGSPCCNDNGHECHDAYCGPWRAGWGVGGNGKCGFMNGNNDGDVVNDAVTGLTGGTRAFLRALRPHTRAARRRRLPRARHSRDTDLPHADLPDCRHAHHGDGTCTEGNQCASGLFCNKAMSPSRCTRPCPPASRAVSSTAARATTGTASLAPAGPLPARAVPPTRGATATARRGGSRRLGAGRRVDVPRALLRRHEPEAPATGSSARTSRHPPDSPLGADGSHRRSS